MKAVEKDIQDRIRAHGLNLDGRRLPYGFGAAWLRTPDKVAVLEAAYTKGFRYFDTSRDYGESERIVGRFLKQVPRGSLFLATKSHIFEAAVIDSTDPAVSQRSVAQWILKSFEESLERLGTDYVDLYQIHDVDSLAHLDLALEELKRLQAEGQIRWIGLATRDLGLLEQGLDRGAFDTILTYSDFTPLRQTAASVLRRAAKTSCGRINASPLGGWGLMRGVDPRTLRFPRATGEKFAREMELAASFYDLCQAIGASPLTFALQFPIMNSDIDITLTGPETLEQLTGTLNNLTQPIDPLRWRAWDRWRKAL